MEKKIVKLMIDGNYTFHIHKYIKNNNKYIDWDAFKEFIKDYILRTENQVAQIVFDSKYFVGTEKHTTDADRDFLYNTLDHSDIRKIANQLKSNGNKGLKEDAVDVALAIESIADYYEARDENKYSYFVILAGDSDFVPLINKLKSYGIKTILVYLDFTDGSNITKCSQVLLEKVDDRIDLQILMNERVDPIRMNVLRKYSSNRNNTVLNTTQFNNRSIKITWDNIFSAMDRCNHLAEGYVLCAELGLKLKEMLRIEKLPDSLKNILEKYDNKLDFIQEPYQVKLKREVYLSTR